MPPSTATRHHTPFPTVLVAAVAGLGAGATVAWAHWLDRTLVVGMTPVLGIALAAVLLVDPRRWALPLLVVAGAVTGVGLLFGVGVRAALAPAAVGVVGALVAGSLLRLFATGSFRLRRTGDVAALVVLGAVGAVVGAVVGAAVAGYGPLRTDFWEATARAAFAAWLGVVVVTTLALSWTTPIDTTRRPDPREVAILGSAVVGLGILAFCISTDPRAYGVVLILVWAAIRFRVRGVTLAAFAMIAIADWAVAHDAGPMAAVGHTAESAVLTLQTFAAATLLGLIFLAVALDERDGADARRHVANARFRRTFERSPVGIAITTPDGVVLDANRALCSMLGYSRPELVGTELEAFRSAEETTGEVPISDLMVTLGDAASTERRYVSAHGERVWAEVSESEVRDPDGEPECVIVLLNDVTRRKDLEGQVLHSQKMDAVGRLAGGIAHDFNNLLAVMRGHAELLEDDLAVLEQARQRLVAMQRATDRAAALTDDLLTFSRRSTDEPDVVDVHDVLGAAHDMLAQLAGTAVDVELRLGATATRVEADPRRVEQVLVNLVVNASDAMPHGGRLVIATDNVLGVTADGRPAQALQIAVTDTGVGITPQVQRRIFEPFFTTKPAGSGTGLGLSTAQGVVRRYGGTITVQSELGEGTTFLITLPLTERPAAATGIPPAEAPGAGRAPETILVVDDETDVRNTVAEVLRGRGYRVLEAANGGSALDIVTRAPTPIDLVVSDVVMPGMDGPELADRIRVHSPDTQVLFVSGQTDIEPSSPCLRGSTLLRKPVHRATLIAQVERVLGARHPRIRARSGTPRP